MNEKVVVILGAGASHHYGGPLVNRFLDVSEQFIQSSERFDTESLIGIAVRARNVLRRVQADSVLEIDNIEDLLTAIDTADILQTKILETFDSERLANLYRELIARTVEESVDCKPFKNKNRCCPLQLLHRKLSSTHGLENVSYITFNYDLSLECALYKDDLNVNYFEPPSPEAIAVRKLHGSVNWFRSRESGDGEGKEITDVTPVSAIFDLQNIQRAESLTIQRNCRKIIRRSAAKWQRLIIPPTFVKSYRIESILQTWRQASQELKQATRVIFIGYSMPPTDSTFRHFFGLSNLEGTFIKDVTVVRPYRAADSNAFESNYRSVFGPSLEKRLNFYRGGLETFAHHFPCATSVGHLRDIGLPPTEINDLEQDRSFSKFLH